MEDYGLSPPLLHPNAVHVMSAFAHLCEAFVGIYLSATLFRRYYLPRIDCEAMFARALLYRFSAQLTRLAKGEYIHRQVEPPTWEGWRGSSWYVLALPYRDWYEEVDMSGACSKGLREDDPRLTAVVNRIKQLQEQGLTIEMVVADFLRRRLAPLQKRSHA